MRSAARIAAWAGYLLQGFAVYAALTRSLVWPLHWPVGLSLWVTVWLLYVIGSGLTNGMLTAEFVRKTQLESDLAAAQQIQRTLQPEVLIAPQGYEVEAISLPFRGVGGDYFDVVDLPLSAR